MMMDNKGSVNHSIANMTNPTQALDKMNFIVMVIYY